jgi:hypothetical protein
MTKPLSVKVRFLGGFGRVRRPHKETRMGFFSVSLVAAAACLGVYRDEFAGFVHFD